MRVVVSSPYGIKEVRAEIQTDHKKQIIPLKRVGIASWRNLTPPRYRVLAGGELKVLSEKEIAQNYARLVAMDESGQANLAQAAEKAGFGPKEIWLGSWVVADTHETTYRTVFIAADNQGNSGRLTLAWSDPCTDLTNHKSGNYSLSSSCTLAMDDGIAAGNLTGAVSPCSSGTLCNLSTLNHTFAVYPNYHITLDGKYKISIGTGGAVKFTYLWVKDNDGDGYPPVDFIKLAQNSGPTGYVRQESLTSLAATDCDDASKLAFPGTNVWYSSPLQSGSYDYNCNGTEEKKDTVISSGPLCYWDDIALACYSLSSGSGGWVSSAPACGQSGTYRGGGVVCSKYTSWSTCVSAGESTLAQSCH